MQKKKENKTTLIDVQFTAEDMANLINTLSIAKHLFESSAALSYDKGDMETFKQLTDRIDLCNIFIDRLIKNITIGEPTNETKH